MMMCRAAAQAVVVDYENKETPVLTIRDALASKNRDKHVKKRFTKVLGKRKGMKHPPFRS